ncbi:transcriptional regulator [Candidatus Fermentibacterales bacterium]|nr:transcriptional regulator [Candidatus Fermentibacterales bacterium]
MASNLILPPEPERARNSLMKGRDSVLEDHAALAVLSMLSVLEEAALGLLARTSGLSEAEMTGILPKLRDEGYLSTDDPSGAWESTVIRITPRGRDAYRSHTAAMRRLLPGPGDGDRD